MIKYLKITIAIALSILLFDSCGTTYIKEIIKSPEFSTGENTTAYLVVFDDVTQKGFKRTFKKKYDSTVDFTLDYSNALDSKLQFEKVFPRMLFYNSRNKHNRNIYPKTANRKVVLDSILNNCRCNYLICLDKIKIKSKHTYSMGFNGANSHMSSGSSQEHCEIESLISIYKPKTKKKIMEFETKGSGAVYFFSYKAAFDESIDNSVSNAVEYLKTGRTKESMF